MQNFFKYLIILFFIMTIIVVFYFIYEDIKNKKMYHKHDKLKKWQRDRIQLLLENRIQTINTTGKPIASDEIYVLNNLVTNIEKLIYWENLFKLTNDERTISFVNIAIMDELYKLKVDTIESKNKFLQNLFLLDCVNGGVKFNNKKPICYPKDIDIKKTIQIIINNQKELTSTQSDILTSFIANTWKERSPETYEEFKKEYFNNNFKTIIPDSAIEKTLEELINKKSIKDISGSARYVICKIIIEILSNIIYSGNNYEKLSENAKIYIRILSHVIANEQYEIIYEKFNKN